MFKAFRFLLFAAAQIFDRKKNNLGNTYSLDRKSSALSSGYSGITLLHLINHRDTVLYHHR